MCIRDSSYHPQANGLVERFHRQLKASLMARLTYSTWMNELPIVLLSIRSSWRTELDCSPADLTFGSSLRLPGELVGDSSSLIPTTSYVNSLQTKIRKLIPVQMSHHTVPNMYVPSSLEKSKFVYVRCDSHRTPLVCPYDGPFRIIEKHSK